LARLAQIPRNPQLTSDLGSLLASVYDIISKSPEDQKIESIKDVLSFFTKSPFNDKLWSFNDAHMKFAVTLPLFCDPSLVTSMVTVPPYTFGDGTWSEWFVQVSLGCDKLLESNGYGLEDHISIIQLYSKLVERLPYSRPVMDERLHHIRNPYVGFMVWVQNEFQHGAISLALEAQPLKAWTGPIWEAFVETCSVPDASHICDTPPGLPPPSVPW
jgi:hypothetical protein